MKKHAKHHGMKHSIKPHKSAYGHNMDGMQHDSEHYAGEMICEDMRAPGNLPMEVVRRDYDTMGGIHYDYAGNASAEYHQQMEDKMVAERQRAKRRY